jgi:hypothetical protein
VPYALGFSASKAVGDGREYNTYNEDKKAAKEGDKFKDLWNNNIGRFLSGLASSTR